MRDMDELRPLTAGRVLALWRESREASGDPLERTLLCNGRILARCCFFRGAPVYQDGTEALEDLTGRQMERLLLRLAEGGGEETLPAAPGSGAENPAFDPARFRALGGA